MQTYFRIQTLLVVLVGLGGAASTRAHDIGGGEAHPHYDWSVRPPEVLLAQAQAIERVRAASAANRPAQAAIFAAFAPLVSTRWDERFLFVESRGLPAHGMMVGITAWQQQVPLPQNYTGANAWRIPLVPVVAKEPRSIKGQFLRGAIALAANGIPIFNPQNNRGEVSQEIGELDEWGGHCGRSDDYHYHAAPLHLQTVLGKDKPIAYALDGYGIFGLTEPDGTAPAGLDAFNGHTTAVLGYHYHASKKYPYVNGGFHGEVVELGGQVDPQPRATPVRPALQQLRGAKITAFTTSPDGKERSLIYTVSGKEGAVNYADLGGGSWKFLFVSTDGSKQGETYQAREGRGGGAGGGPRPQRGDERGGPPPRDAAEPLPREGRGEPPASGGPVVAMDAMKKPSATFSLASPEIATDGKLPVDYTGDGSGATLPLAWKGAPTGTQSFALVMDHLAPGNVVKSYWTMWDIPATTTSLPKNAQGVGKIGTSFKGQLGYEPPHSQGPGEKTYVLTVYALSAAPQITQAPREVSREVLLTAIKNKVLASASLNFVYAREGAGGAPPGEGRPPRREVREAPQTPGSGSERPSRPRERESGKPGDGLVKAAMTDTMKAEIYADNWFALYINGRLAVVDPIAFLPHNVVSVDLLPEYPMTIAVIAHDNADAKTGLEYGNHIGDAGFVLKFADGTVTDGTWKVKAIERGPIGGDIANPRVETEPRPANWFAPDFDDSKWESATVFTEQQVNPKQPYFEHDFKGAQFIWSKDLGLDNTVLFRKRVEKPGWTPRWTAQPAGPLPQP
ncbi:MAG: YHYH protein [Chthoniobacter sp.]|nr:YHYH protein [Chthoniobacter sp.]